MKQDRFFQVEFAKDKKRLERERKKLFQSLTVIESDSENPNVSRVVAKGHESKKVDKRTLQEKFLDNDLTLDEYVHLTNQHAKTSKTNPNKRTANVSKSQLAIKQFFMDEVDMAESKTK